MKEKFLDMLDFIGNTTVKQRILAGVATVAVLVSVIGGVTIYSSHQATARESERVKQVADKKVSKPKLAETANSSKTKASQEVKAEVEKKAKADADKKAKEKAEADAKAKAEADKKATEEKAKAEATATEQAKAETPSAPAEQQATDNVGGTPAPAPGPTPAPAPETTPQPAPQAPAPIPTPQPAQPGAPTIVVGSVGNSGMLFNSITEAHAWADPLQFDENSQWYLKSVQIVEVVYSDGSRKWTVNFF